MKMKSVNIKGSKYITVNERLKYFRSNENFIGWRIDEEVVSVNEKEGIFKTSIYDSEGNLIVSAHSQEYRDNSYINKTSFLENGFTSALGRALGYLGIGIDASVSSADEVQTAIHNQTKVKRPFLTEDQLAKTLNGTKEQAETVFNRFEVKPEHKKPIKNKFKI